MHISERTVGDVVIVDLSGKVTLGDGGDVVLKDKMQSLVQQGRKKVLLNLADVSYVDSAGLGEIVQSYATVMKYSPRASSAQRLKLRSEPMLTGLR